MVFGDFLVVKGESLTGGPFCNCPIVYGGATITGYKFQSDNCIDIVDPLGGWEIQLWKINLDGSETEVATTLTDANGQFTFENVAAGIYKVVEVQQGGWVACTNSPLRTEYLVIVNEGQAGAGDSITSDFYGDALQFFNSAV